MRRHTPTLYSHPESGVRMIGAEDEDDWEPEVISPNSNSSRSTRLPLRSYNSYASSATTVSIGVASSASSSRATTSKPRQSDAYTQWMKRYRTETGDNNDHYFYRGQGRLMEDDASDDDDDGHPALQTGALSQVSALSQEFDPENPEQKKRLEWHALLGEVLRSEVLKSEKSRLAEHSLKERNDSPQGIWLGIRAKLHSRTEADELKRIEEQRLRVDAVIEDINTFRVPMDEYDTISALKLVKSLLSRLDAAMALYPNLKAFHSDKLSTEDPAFQNRCDTLCTWSTVLETLLLHIKVLQSWTGSDTLDVTQPNTSPEKPIPGHAIKGQPDVADRSTFVERVLKENSLQHTFERGALNIVHGIISGARDCQVNLHAMLTEMNLPFFEKELVILISFPTKLVQASLIIRLDYVNGLKDPEVLIIDQMTDDLKLSIGLACTLKQQYVRFMEPDSEGFWSLPPCISADYDSTILEALKVYFRLIHGKLKSGAKSVYFKETDVLEGHWATFNDVSLNVPGGSVLVAEQICGLTNKLLLRVTNYFETQIRFNPDDSVTAHTRELNNSATRSTFHAHLSGHFSMNAEMTDLQLVGWYEKILEGVRLRYRKLQRFARALAQRFNNSAEYDLDPPLVDQVITSLVATDHFLVYTTHFEEQSTYIIASKSLYERPHEIRRLLHEAFHLNEIMTENGPRIVDNMDVDIEYEYDEARYLLVVTPTSQFVWKGRVLILETSWIDLDVKDNRIRLIANGPQRRLLLAKQEFARIFELSQDLDTFDSTFGPDTCFIYQQAHLPTVNKMLRRISSSTNRLAESIVDSVHQVRASLRISKGFRELMVNWYMFASDYGRHAQKYIEPSAVSRFNDRMINLALSWDSFICDDCDPNDKKTFRWAMAALEFTLDRTKRFNILALKNEQFEVLSQKVSPCMTIILNHIDVMGARSSQAAEKAREAKLEKLRMEAEAQRDMSVEPHESEPDSSISGPYSFVSPSDRAFWERVSEAARLLEVERAHERSEHRLGRVLDDGKAEDRSLVFLASLSSNISVKWQQQKFIGAGSFGSVYLAVNLDSGSFMAVKEIKFQELSGMPDMHKGITDELRVMEMLHHPNVVEYYGIEVHRDKVYIFEEYCSGGSLASLLEHGRIEDEQAIQMYTTSLLEGLAYLHSQGIVHRDIKPDNILLDHRGVIKYADFGAAKVLAKGQRTVHKSRRIADPSNMMGALSGGLGLNNSITGTPMYMSPEVIKNDKRGRPGAMDVWSVGCIVLEFSTGKKPWSNLDNEWAIMFHIGVATQHPPLPEPDQLSEMGINFIKQCLTIDPMRRPSAVELLDHPWMAEFRETMLNYEDEGSEDGEAEDDGTFLRTTVARHAMNARAEEVATITASTPTPPIEGTP